MNDSESPETFEARRQRNIAKHVNGNGMGTPLAMAVGGKRRLNPRFVAWLMGFDPDWCAELPRVDALRCYGNAVVPAQGAYAMRLLMEALDVEG